VLLASLADLPIDKKISTLRKWGNLRNYRQIPSFFFRFVTGL
jgi:hypothetical protein